MQNHIVFFLFLNQRCQILQIIPGRAASVIAHTPEEKRNRLFFRLFQEFIQFLRRMTVNGIVVFIRAVNDDLRSIKAFP